MVTKIQLNDINFNDCICVKDKYNRVVDGISHGRSIYFDKVNQVYYKVFHPEYCRLENFRKAIEINFFDGLADALTSLIYDGNNLIGYVTKAGPLLSPNEFDKFSEYQFSVDNLEQFSGFTIKIVMISTNESYPVRLKDFRAIALA